MEYIQIGKIINTHGVKGELKVDVYTDFLEDRFKKNSKVYLGDDKIEVIVKTYRIHNGFMLLTLKELEDINLVEKYKHQIIYKDSKDIKALKDDYYFRDLKDLDVYVDNEKVGKILYLETGTRSNLIRIKKLDNKEVLVPYLPQFVLGVDINNKRMDIVKMEGLL